MICTYFSCWPTLVIRYLRVIAEESATARIISKDPSAEATMKAAERGEELCQKALLGLDPNGNVAEVSNKQMKSNRSSNNAFFSLSLVTYT